MDLACPFADGASPIGADYGGCGEIVATPGGGCALAIGTASSSCEDAFPCVACERSPCRMGTDCHTCATKNMTGDYHPNCRCECKEGYEGPKCEIAVVENGLYASEYEATCTFAPIDATAAGAACAARGAGWSPATVPTAQSAAAIAPLLDPFAPAAVGAFFVELSSGTGIGSWMWGAGRLSGKAFASQKQQGTATLCEDVLFNPVSTSVDRFTHCPWGAGEPASGGGGGGCGYFSTPNALLGSGDCGPSSSLRCVVCERSPCRMGTDCHAVSTINMTGDYYPNCHCECKEGYEGPKCETAIHSDPLYESHYSIECNALAIREASGYTHAEARAVCAARGDGWDLATFPSKGSFAALSALISPARSVWM